MTYTIPAPARRHPNYVAIIIEIFTIPVMCRAYATAVVFSLLNALVLTRRIPEEERALKKHAGAPLLQVPRFIPRTHSRSPGGRSRK